MLGNSGKEVMPVCKVIEVMLSNIGNTGMQGNKDNAGRQGNYSGKECNSGNAVKLYLGNAIKLVMPVCMQSNRGNNNNNNGNVGIQGNAGNAGYICQVLEIMLVCKVM